MQSFSGTSLEDLQQQLGGEGAQGGVQGLLEPLHRIQQGRRDAEAFLREAEGR